jgi:hypothetical protein
MTWAPCAQPTVARRPEVHTLILDPDLPKRLQQMQIFFAYNILGTAREMSSCTLVYGKCRTVCLIVAMPPSLSPRLHANFQKVKMPNAGERMKRLKWNFSSTDVQWVCLPTFHSGSHCAQSIQKWAVRTAEERSNAAPLLPNHACISSHQCSYSFIKASKR